MSKGKVLQLYKEGTAPVDVASMITRYDFSDGSGATLTDSSGNGNDGTISNATWAVGTTGFSSGNSLSFDGNADYVTLPTGMLTNKAAFTVDLFFRIGDLQENETRSLYFRTNTTVSDQFYIQANTNKFVADLGSLTSRPTLVTNYVFAPGVWYFVRVVWDSGEAVDTDRLKVYVNGIRDTATPSTGSGSTSNTGTWSNLIGYTTAAAFNGNISFVALHDSAMTAADTLTIYNASIKKSGNYLVDGVWQMVEERTTTAASQFFEFQARLDGDQDGGYMIEAYINGNTSGLDCNYRLAINGRTCTVERSYIFQSGASSYVNGIQSGVADATLGLDVTTARQGFVQYYCYFPESSCDNRYFFAEATHNGTGGNRVEDCRNVIQVTTPTAATNIVSIGIHAQQALGMIAGCKYRLYKLNFKYEQ